MELNCTEESATAFHSHSSKTIDAIGVTDSEMALEVYGHASTQENKLDGMYDPVRILQSTAPPKWFFRTFWRSISLRLLNSNADTALTFSKQGLFQSHLYHGSNVG